MPLQQNSWSCSVYSFMWVCQSTMTDSDMTYDEALAIIGYPDCVNPTYGLMSAQCMIDAFSTMGLHSKQIWCTYDEAFAICERHTGVINPIGMYHFMAIRGVRNESVWVANSSPGYRGIYDDLNRSNYNNLGPVQLIYLE
jgi:hypothetical protein